MGSPVTLPGELTRHRWLLLVLFTALVLFFVTQQAPVSYVTISDPRFSLLVSQAIVDHHTIKLDAYVGTPNLPLEEHVGRNLVQRNGHYYYYFPLGPSVFSVPAVWLVRLFDKDMANFWHERALQNYISAGLCALIFVLVYALARCYLDNASSFAIAGVSIFGSALTSTLGTALWPHTYAVFFEVVALLLLARRGTGRSDTWHPVLLGSVLFAVFFSRPSTAPFILLVLLYVLFEDRAEAVTTAVTAATLLLGLLVFEYYEYGEWLSAYLSPARFQAARSFDTGTALYGLLLSPSRGLLIFSPFFVLVLADSVIFFRSLRDTPLFWMSVSWFGLHLALVSRAPRWWGGWSFGPRLLTDVVPALVLLTVLLWREARQRVSHWKPLIVAAYALLGIVAIWINSVQGLYNRDTVRWNGTMPPNVDREPAYLFDWNYSQFLATTGSVCARNRGYMQTIIDQEAPALKPYRIGEHIPFLQADAFFIGWSVPGEFIRWSECPTASILFRLARVDPQATYLLEVWAGTHERQTVRVEVNGRMVGEMPFSSPHVPPQVRRVTVPGRVFRADVLNEITFHIPGAYFPGDPRPLGLSFNRLLIKLDTPEEIDAGAGHESQQNL